MYLRSLKIQAVKQKIKIMFSFKPYDLETQSIYFEC